MVGVDLSNQQSEKFRILRYLLESVQHLNEPYSLVLLEMILYKVELF